MQSLFSVTSATYFCNIFLYQDSPDGMITMFSPGIPVLRFTISSICARLASSKDAAFMTTSAFPSAMLTTQPANPFASSKSSAAASCSAVSAIFSTAEAALFFCSCSTEVLFITSRSSSLLFARTCSRFSFAAARTLVEPEVLASTASPISDFSAVDDSSLPSLSRLAMS